MDSHLTDTGVTVITTRGDLDLDGTRQLRQPLISATSAQQPLVVLDLAGLEFLDSSGISLLVHGVKRVRARGGALVLAAAPAKVARLFEVTGLTRVFEIFPTTEDANAQLSARAGLDSSECGARS
ncbi:STAS domain-containing protein [Catenulispora yoronensis]|uniref:STAS domain-containing protein n=1 Tax=Catenulispora yoronensis TaxID=450799 RepID=UPI0031E33A0C